MSTTPSPMVQMYAPDGTFGEVPYEQMHSALQAGGKMAVHMTAPDGTDGYVPADRLQEATKAGGKIVPYDLDQQAPKPGFLASVGNTLKAMAPNAQTTQSALSPSDAIKDAISPGIRPVQNAIQEAQAASARGHGPLYSGVAGLSTLAGVNPERMEAGAEQGNPNAVLAEAAVPAAATLGAAGAKAGLDALPSAEHAGAGFQSLSKAIGDHPVAVTDDLSGSLNALRKATTTTNTNIPPVVRKLIDRLDPFQGGGPFTYDEARAFSSEINQLSASDKLSMTPNTKRLVGDLNQKLKGAVQNTADLAGKGQDLSDAMNEYRQAMKVQGLSDTAKEEAIKWALRVAGGYGAWKLIGSATH